MCKFVVATYAVTYSDPTTMLMCQGWALTWVRFIFRRSQENLKFAVAVTERTHDNETVTDKRPALSESALNVGCNIPLPGPYSPALGFIGFSAVIAVRPC